MFLLLPSFFLAAYAVCSGVLTLRTSRSVKVILSLIVLGIALKYQAYTAAGGTLLEPAVQGKAMLCYEGLYGALVVFTALLFLKDMASLGLVLLRKFGVALDFGFNRNRIIAALAGLSLIAGAWGLWEAIRVPDVRTIEVTVKNLPRQWRGTKIVQLSDLHIGPVQGEKWLSEIVDKVNRLEPDLVLITGDLVDGKVRKILPQLQPLSRIKAKYGVFVAVGNHEYYSGYREWTDAFARLGLTVLQNESAVLKKDNVPLVIGGTTDFGASRFDRESPSLAKTFGGTPAQAVRILLTHQPKTTKGSPERTDLQLSGHTHGGHIFFLYPLIAVFNDGLVSGLYQRKDRLIYVNRGAGLWNGFSVRLGVPSEITEMILR